MKNLLQKLEPNRKLRNFITLCFVCLLAIGNAWGYVQTWTYEVVQSSPTFFTNSPVTVNDATWNFAINSTVGSPSINGTTSSYSATYGWKYGNSKNAYYGSYTLSTDYFAGKNVKSVTVNILNNGTKSGTMTVIQGNVQIGSDTKNFGQVWNDLTANTNLGTGGTLYITYAVDQASCIHSIIVEYEEAVATPTFTPEAGTYTEAQNVAISCGMQDATIYYTTDGSTPTVESNPYSDSFDITSTTTVKAIAIKNGVSSDVATATYTIEPIVPGAWQLVTDASTLAVGDRVVIAAADYNYAMSTTQNSNNRGQAAINKSGNSITWEGSNVQEFTLVEGEADGTFAFYDNDRDGYIYAASSSSNYLRTETLISINSSWTIEISEGVASIIAQGNYERNDMRYNPSSSLFSCYTSASQKAVVLYKFIPDQPQVENEWELVDIADLRVWDEIAIVDVNSGKAMSNNDGENAAPTAVTVTLSADHSTITSEVGNELKWTRSGDASGYWFFPKGSSSMLYVNDNGDLAIGAATATSKQFKANSENGYTGLKHKTTSKFIGVDGYSWTASETISGNMANTSIAYYRHKLYSVYFMEGNGSCETASLMQSEFGGSITLPSAAPCSECSGYQFAGWATAPVNETYDAPTLFTGNYTPTEDDQFLYAVYKNGTVYNSNPACAVINVTSETPYVENFEGHTTSTAELTHAKPSCWTLVYQYNPMQANQRAQIATASAASQSGTHSLNMRYSGIMAMPILADGVDIQDLQMDLYLKQPGAQYLLEVGVMSDLTDESTFEVVATLDNGSTQMEHRTVYFSSYVGNGSYIAFRNVFAPGTNGKLCYNYIDDITLSIATNACEITVTAEEPYTEDFDNYTNSTAERTGVEPDCWMLVHQDNQMSETTKPQIMHNTGAYVHSGEYSLSMQIRGIYAMPKLAQNVDLSSLQMDFYVKQLNAGHQLQIGVLTDVNDISTYTVIATINNAGSQMEHRVVDFSSYQGEGRYIAFRNTLSDGVTSLRSYNYIDDITLSIASSTNECEIEVAADQPYIENFDSYTDITAERTGVEPDCWTLVQQDERMSETTKPQIMHNKGAYVHSGEYSLSMQIRGIYAMPKLAQNVDVRSLQMDFYVKQLSAGHELQVGVLSDLNDGSTFVPVATINNSTTKMEHNVVDFSSYTGEGRYIAFRNTLSDGVTSLRSYNYIDDITLSIATPETRLAENEQVSEEVETVEETEETASYDNEDNFSLLTREPEVTVYPNPTTGNLHFAAMENVEKVEVYNNIGRLVATFNNQREINISDMPAGLYMLRVTLQGDAVVMKKVVKK